MLQYQQLLKDIKAILIDMAIKGDFDQCDMNDFDVDKLRPAFKKHTKRLKDNAVVYSTDENHDDPALYNTKMVKLSTAIGLD